MRVERHNKSPLINKGPKSQINRRIVTHHPTQKHTYSFTCRILTLWFYRFNVPVSKKCRYCNNSRITVMTITFYEITQCTIFYYKIMESRQKLMNRMVSIKSIITFIIIRDIPFETTCPYPTVNITMTAIKDILYLWKKLLPATIRQRGSYKSKELLIGNSAYLMHKPGRISVQELFRLKFICITMQQFSHIHTY